MMDPEDELNAYWRSQMWQREQREKDLRLVAATPRCTVIVDGMRIENAHLMPYLPVGAYEGMLYVCVLHNDLPDALLNKPEWFGQRPDYIGMIVPKDDVTIVEDNQEEHG